MSLLDDVSIVVTPNGYKARTLYGVLPTPILGTEEVTYPNFTNSDISQWNIASSRATKSWDASEFMRLTYDLASGSALYSSLGHTLNVVYKVTMRVRGTKADGTTAQGSAFSSIGDNNELGRAISNPTLTADWQDYEFYTVPTSSTFRFYLASAVIGDLVDFDSISVKEYTSADMDVTRATAATRVDENGLVNYAEVLGGDVVTNGDFTQLPLGTGWDAYTSGSSTVAFTEGAILSIDGSNSNVGVYQQNIFTSGVQYKIVVSVKATASFDALVSETDAASSKGTIGTLNLTTSYQDFSFYYTGTGTWDLFIHRKYGETAGQNQQIYIKDVSVKEVTRDNVPRIDYTGGGCPHILAEPQRTNEVTYSSDFTSGWSTSDATITANSTISPDGTQNASTLTTTASGGTVQESLSISDGDIAFSLFVKKGSTDGVRLRIDASTDFNAYFDLTDGTIHSTTGNAKIETLDNDWYKISVSASVTSFVKASIYTTDGTTSYDNGTVFIWGAQLEEGSYPTSYIPTSGSTVTRNQDIFTRDGIGSLINSTEGVLFIEMAALANDGTYREISLSDGTSTNRVEIRYGTSSNSIQAIIRNGSYVILQHNLSTIVDSNKVAFKWKTGDFALWVNGVEVATDITAFVTSGLNRLAFDQGTTGNTFFGKVKQLQVYKTALTDTQLAALTS